jgi:NADH-quinone oxidoreductase subunit L
MIATLLLFMGAMGKSAQFPLHVWLPDAMAGPTPGSALIHAATMVAAGVYLVARSFPLFEANPATLTVVATIGTITAVMAALIALAMDDIKKVLAYSTISQLGLMMLALGMGSWVAAIFHLMTHAFFKALLFLAAGSVIHGTHTQDVREMGGLWRKMPWTTVAWVVGALSLAGIPPLAGFWSKDEILLAALRSGNTGFLVAGLFVAALTAFYMGRTTFLAFFAKPGPTSKSAEAHESPWVMTAPLVILATLAAVAGLIGSPLANYAFGGYLGEHAAGEINYVLATIAVGAALAGIGYAWLMYQRGRAHPDWYMRSRMISSGLNRQFWIDDAYQRVLIEPALVIAGFFRRIDTAVVDGAVRAFGRVGLAVSGILARFDRGVVDGAVDGLGNSVVEGGRETRRIETGNVQTYLLLLAASIVILLWVFAR